LVTVRRQGFCVIPSKTKPSQYHNNNANYKANAKIAKGVNSGIVGDGAIADVGLGDKKRKRIINIT
jgi:hypothetical protein